MQLRRILLMSTVALFRLQLSVVVASRMRELGNAHRPRWPCRTILGHAWLAGRLRRPQCTAFSAELHECRHG